MNSTLGSQIPSPPLNSLPTDANIDAAGIQDLITELAQQVRHAGHVEAAHFMEIAALAINEP
jgi:hypothetical protein